MPVTGSACRDLSVRPRTLRFHFGGSAHEVRFTAPTGRGRIRPLPVSVICLRGRCLVPHTSCATPASAPDILSSDAFQDLPSSGAGVISHGMRGGGWSGYAYPTADGAIGVVEWGIWFRYPPNGRGHFCGIWRDLGCHPGRSEAESRDLLIRVDKVRRGSRIALRASGMTSCGCGHAVHLRCTLRSPSSAHPGASRDPGRLGPVGVTRVPDYAGMSGTMNV